MEAFSKRIVDGILSLARLIYWHINKRKITNMCQTIIDAYGTYNQYKGKHFHIDIDSALSIWTIRYDDVLVVQYSKRRGWIVLRQGDWFGEFIELYQRGLQETFGKYEGAI